jgi:type I restriction enzyme, R subunit
MKLLIVVSKLLTGFDARSCTYIYLDNGLRDHNFVPSDLPHQPS